MRWWWLATVLTLTACDKKENPPEAKLAPSASALVPPRPPAKLMKFAIDTKGTSSIDMPAPKEHIKATTDTAAGTLEIDPANLVNSRGEVKIDLSTLTMSTFADDSKNRSQTMHARCWLEVGDCEEGKLTDDVKKANRYAVYAVRSIESPSATALAKIAVTKDGADEVRTVTLTTKGDLSIHGHKAESRDAEIEIQLRYAPGASADNPKAIAVKTKKPLRVTLAEHDVKPRDRLGKIAKSAFHLLGTKVADTADISLDLRASPQS